MSFSKNADFIINCMSDSEKIRNICILAHVDHGKTTIADILLSTNGLISKRSAGQIRYLDDRQDEQERGITMKSSAVSLLYVKPIDDKSQENYIINLIDTPGHIDFSTEVTAAIRICDGAIIVVDIVEGVCVQTKDAIKQAFDEHIVMVLVINKLDRLIVELNKNVDEIFQSILRVIEDCNAYVAELYHYDLDSDGIENDALFSPETGNVIFASGLDGWAFTTQDIAELFCSILKEESESINIKLWNFDYYVDSNKKILSGAVEKKKDNLFIQLCLKTIYFVYYTLVVRMEKDKLPLILSKLNITKQTREMKHNDPKVQVRAILQAWKPLGACVMNQCQKIIPSPNKMQELRCNSMINMSKYSEDKILNEAAENMTKMLKNPDFGDKSNIIVYVSKMFSVNKKNLSQNKPKVFVPSLQSKEAVLAARKETEEKIKQLQNDESKNVTNITATPTIDDDVTIENRIIGIARVFSGELKCGKELYIIPHDHNPTAEKDVEEVTITELYMLLGRELILVDSVPAGNICGIGGLEQAVIRTATLTNNLNCLPIVEKLCIEPIVRNSVEPVNPKHLPTLRKGLKLLMQSDSCVQVSMQETGEYVLLTAGDVHLAKCLEDLTTKFAKIDINVSKPMVALKETLIKQKRILDFKINSVECNIKEIGLILHITTVPLPKKLVNVFKTNFKLLRMIEDHQENCESEILKMSESVVAPNREKLFKNENTKKLVLKLKEQLNEVFKNCYNPWTELNAKIWSVGKSHDSINILFNCVKNYSDRNIFNVFNTSDLRTSIDNCIINAFDMTCRAGPICEEPIANCAFVITNFQLKNYEIGSNLEQKTQFFGNIPVILKQTFREAFQKQAQRLMEPIFTTDIYVNTSILGESFSLHFIIFHLPNLWIINNLQASAM